MDGSVPERWMAHHILLLERCLRLGFGLEDVVLKAYAVNIRGFSHPSKIIYHESAGKAKYQFFLDVTDVYPDLKYTQITACRVGVDPDNMIHRDFARTAIIDNSPKQPSLF